MVDNVAVLEKLVNLPIALFIPCFGCIPTTSTPRQSICLVGRLIELGTLAICVFPSTSLPRLRCVSFVQSEV